MLTLPTSASRRNTSWMSASLTSRSIGVPWYFAPRRHRSRSACAGAAGSTAIATSTTSAQHRIQCSVLAVTLQLPFQPPVEPMLAKLANEIPEGDSWLYEPKWDGFRALVFKDGDELYIQSRDLKPLGRYFPELEAPLRASLPERCVLDGEIVIATDGRLDFEALLLRIHPAASRVADARRAEAGVVRRVGPARARRRGPARAAAGRAARAPRGARSPSAKPPSTSRRRRAIARRADWFERFEGAGLDGVMAKPDDLAVPAGQARDDEDQAPRTADCVVAGFRWYKGGKGTLVGSLLLGLYDDEGVLHHVGVARVVQAGRARRARRGARAAARGRARGPSVERLGRVAGRRRPSSGMPGATSRWNRGKDLSWEPLRIELVGEVALRSPAGHAVPPRDALQALAPRQAAERLPLRSARGDAAARDQRDLRHVAASASSSQRPCRRTRTLSRVVVGIRRLPAAGARASGTFLRLMRMRYHAVARPRIRVDEDVLGRELRGDVGVARLPALEARERVGLLLRLRDRDHRQLRLARGLARLRARRRDARAPRRPAFAKCGGHGASACPRASWRSASSSSASSEPGCVVDRRVRVAARRERSRARCAA